MKFLKFICFLIIVSISGCQSKNSQNLIDLNESDQYVYAYSENILTDLQMKTYPVLFLKNPNLIFENINNKKEIKDNFELVWVYYFYNYYRLLVLNFDIDKKLNIGIYNHNITVQSLKKINLDHSPDINQINYNCNYILNDEKRFNNVNINICIYAGLFLDMTKTIYHESLIQSEIELSKRNDDQYIIQLIKDKSNTAFNYYYDGFIKGKKNEN